MSCCHDCGLKYSSTAWVDVIVPDTLWKLISPTGDEGGLLCFNCMNKKFIALNLRNVPYLITSGPFCFMVRDITGKTTEAGHLAEMEAKNADSTA